MSSSFSSGNGDNNYDILTEHSPNYETLSIRSSKDRYLDFKRDYPDLLRNHDITDDNYILTPNGTGEFTGLWVPPYKQLHIWDFHINRDWSIPNRMVFYQEDDSRYIMPPTDENPTYIDQSTRRYPRHLLRLWDFVYNQENFLNPDSTQAIRRNRKFPKKPSEVLPIVPPYLPDTTMPERFNPRYPYAAWETAIYPTSNAQRQAQRYNYISAHSGVEPLGFNSYALEPRDITLLHNPLIRPIYRQDNVPGAFLKGYSPIDYGPIVLRDVKAHTNAGWISLFRQRLKIRTTEFSLPKAPRVLEWYNEAKKVMQDHPQMHPVEVTFTVLPEQVEFLWPDASTRPTNELYRPPRRDKASGNYRILNEKETEAYNILSYLLNLIRTQPDKLFYELDVDTTTDVPSAIFYEEAYKIIVIQVQPSILDAAINFNTSFTGARAWIVSVPPILSQFELRTIDIVTTNAEISWYANDEPSGLLTVRPIGESRHQVRVDIQAAGEYTVYCNTRWGRTTYELASVSITITRVIYTLEKGDELWNLNDALFNRRLWTGIRFSSKALANVRSLTSPQVEEYLRTHWTSDLLSPENYLVVKGIKSVRRLDYLRPLLLVHAHDDRTQWKFVIFELDYLRKYVQTFGQVIRMKVDVPESVRSTFQITWKIEEDNASVIPGGAEPEITVVLPQQLRWYRAEVYAPSHIFTIHVYLDIEWPYPISRKYLSRNDMARQFNEENGGWPLIFSRPRKLPQHTDNDLKYLITSPEGSAESLSMPFEGDFFKALVYCYAKNYHVDLQNYALLYPYVHEYSEHMQHIVDANKERVGIVRDLPDELFSLIPKYMSTPLLFLKLTSMDENDDRIPLAYVIYDPVHMLWRNIYNSEAILSSWNVFIDEAWRYRIAFLFKRTSIEYSRIEYATKQKRANIPKSSYHLQKLAQRTYLNSVYERYTEQLIDVKKLGEEIKDDLSTESLRINNYIDHSVKPTLQYDFLKKMREFFNYLNYICIICSEISVYGKYSGTNRTSSSLSPSSSYDAFNRHFSKNDLQNVLSLVQRLSRSRFGSLASGSDGDLKGFNFTQRLFNLSSDKYVYTLDGVFELLSDSIL